MTIGSSPLLIWVGIDDNPVNLFQEYAKAFLVRTM